MNVGQKSRLLLLDCTIDQPWKLGADFRRYFETPNLEVVVRRAPQQDWPIEFGGERGFSHLLISGSKTGACDDAPWIDRLLESIRQAHQKKTAILGVCFGHQMVARAFGGSKAVRSSPTPEVGWVEVTRTAHGTSLFEGLKSKFYAYESHFDEVASVPSDWIVTARSSRCAIQAYELPSQAIFGIQFHPEKNFDETLVSLKSAAQRGFQKDCIFVPPTAESARNELRIHSRNIANSIFNNFIRQR